MRYCKSSLRAPALARILVPGAVLVLTLSGLGGSEAALPVAKMGAGHVVGFSDAPDQPAIALLAQEAGVAFTNESFAWYIMESSPGTYGFGNQDTFINNAVARGLTVIGDLAFTPQFYSSNPAAVNYWAYPTTSAAGLTAWQAFVTATVNHFKDRVHIWQFWRNISDHAYYVPDPGTTEYYEMLRRAYVAIKGADPTATVVCSAMIARTQDLLLDIGGGAYCDGFGIANYANAQVPGFANPAAPESSAMTVLSLSARRDLLLRRAGGKPIWNSEFGWPTSTNPIGVPEDTSAAYLIRSQLLQAAFPGVDATVWTDFKDEWLGLPWNPANPSQNYGMLLENDTTKKSAFDAYKAMTTALAGASFVRSVPPTPTSTELGDGFEGPQTYQLYTSPGVSGTWTVITATAHSGTHSGRITYNFPAGTGTMVLAPTPTLYLPVAGTPSRFRIWAKGNGGPAPGLTVAFKDATGETFQAWVGMISGTDWNEYVYYLDAPAGTSTLLAGGGGDNDHVIDYPIDFGGVGVSPWSAASVVSAGELFVDDYVFESGPTTFDLLYRSPDNVIHAVWALAGAPTLDIVTNAASATTRDWHNVTASVAASGGKVTVTTGSHPLFVTLPAAPAQAGLGVDAHVGTGTVSNLNGVLEPGEKVVLEPWWRNESAGAIGPLVGTAGTFSGPTGATYTLSDASASLGTLAAGATSDCTLVSDCYTVQLSAPAARPATHWDAQLSESLSDGSSAAWRVHVGGSFTDAPTSYLLYSFVETLLHSGVTAGCTATEYCPGGQVSRAQMAMFIARALANGDQFVPPDGYLAGRGSYSCKSSGGTSQFNDVLPGDIYCRHVHLIAARGVTAGCAGVVSYCPASSVTRGQMAMFVARAMAGSDAAVPVSYTDSVTGRSYDCNGGSPSLNFTDVSTGDLYCRHAHYLWARDVISGCGGLPPQFCPATLVSRGQMAKFLTNGFGLQLYGP